MKRTLLLAAVGLGLALSGCDDFDYALTGHTRPVAEVAGYRLETDDLARLMAESSMPDSVLTAYWAGRFARLWADFVSLAALYQNPDTTRSLDYTRLLEDGRYLAALQVAQYRDSVVLSGIEPTEEELRAYWDSEQPLTRLDVRRVVLKVGEDVSDAAYDSLYAVALAIRDRLAGGADFVEVAREASEEPVQARGRVIAYQGHADFPAAADSIVFDLQPGAISPVIATEDELLIYRIETRRSPDYEEIKDNLYGRLLDERERSRTEETLSSLVDDSHRTIAEGAVAVARRVARDPNLASGRISGRLRLVRWDGGDLVVEELRDLFVVRNDLRERFSKASDEELEDYLLQLARDEILISAAVRSGAAASPEERAALADGLAYQLGRLAVRFHISTQAVASPNFDVRSQSLWFLQGVLENAQAVPWLGEFRVVLDPEFLARVDEEGTEIAARRARELRTAGSGSPAEQERPAEPPEESRQEAG